MLDNSTICAVSTPAGRGGIGIVRLSGPQAVAVAERFFTASNGKRLSRQPAHRLVHGRVTDEEGGVVDEVLASVMRSPHSYTTEDVVEINCHGGIVAVRKTLELMLGAGARLAEPGEFTRRAFLGGRIDLAQAEAVADLINAKTAAGLKAAANQLRGKLSERIISLRDRLADCLARIEATIDFPEDEVPQLPGENVLAVVKQVAGDIDAILPPGTPDLTLPPTVDALDFDVDWTTVDAPLNPTVGYELVELQNPYDTTDQANDFNHFINKGYTLTTVTYNSAPTRV